MKTPAQVLHRSLLIAGLAAPFALMSSLHAQSWDGSGGDNSWSSAANWVGDTLPTFTTADPFATDLDLLFNNLTRPDNNVGISRGVRSITYGADMDGTFATSTRQSSAGGPANLNLAASAGNAKIEILAGATGNISIGSSGVGTAAGSIILGSNLDVIHNGTGVLTLNRPITGTGFGITKTGTGTLELRAFHTATGVLNVDAGTVIAGAQAAAGQDVNAFSAINLRGGTLMVRTLFANKAIDTAPITVSSASTLEMQGVASGVTNYNVTFGGTAGFALNADLAYKNTSTLTTLTNGMTIARAITGSGDISVETYNDIASSSAGYGLGRLALTGDNSGWSGDLLINKGTVSLGGALLGGQASGTGAIVLGKTGDAAGAGLTFFSTAAGASTITYGNNITVNTGGFRSIKGGNTDHGVTFTGAVTLNGDLNVDHTLSSVRALTFSGPISGSGALNVTRFSGSATTAVVLTGANNYSGGTTIAAGATLALGDGGTSGSILGNVSNSGTLVVNRSDAYGFGGDISGTGALSKQGAGALTLTGTNSLSGGTTVGGGALVVDGTFSNAANLVSVAADAALGGNGAIAGNVTFALGADFVFNPTATLDVSGTVSFAGFDMTNVLGLNAATVAGSYVLINATSPGMINFGNVFNVGSSNAFDLGGGTTAYFDVSGGDLSLTVASAIPEPSAFALIGGLASLGLAATRRRSRSV